jgi:hypothetical protein
MIRYAMLLTALALLTPLTAHAQAPAPDPAAGVLSSPVPASDPENDPIRMWVGALGLIYGDGDKRPERSDDHVIGGAGLVLDLWITLDQQIGLMIRGQIAFGALGGDPSMFYGGAVGLAGRGIMDSWRAGVFVGGQSARNTSGRTSTSEFQVYAEAGLRLGDTLSSPLLLGRIGYDAVMNKKGNLYHTVIGGLALEFQLPLPF